MPNLVQFNFALSGCRLGAKWVQNKKGGCILHPDKKCRDTGDSASRLDVIYIKV